MRHNLLGIASALFLDHCHSVVLVIMHLVLELMSHVIPYIIIYVELNL